MQRFTPIPLEYSRSMAVEFINKHSRPQSSLVWAIELADNPGRYAGNIMLKLQSEKNRNVLADYSTAPLGTAARHHDTSVATCVGSRI